MAPLLLDPEKCWPAFSCPQSRLEESQEHLPGRPPGPPTRRRAGPSLGRSKSFLAFHLHLILYYPCGGGRDSRTSGEGGSLSARLFKIYPTATPLSHVRILFFFF